MENCGGWVAFLVDFREYFFFALPSSDRGGGRLRNMPRLLHHLHRRGTYSAASRQHCEPLPLLSPLFDCPAMFHTLLHLSGTTILCLFLWWCGGGGGSTTGTCRAQTGEHLGRSGIHHEHSCRMMHHCARLRLNFVKKSEFLIFTSRYSSIKTN